MLRRKCEKCGAAIEVPPIKCFAGLITGALLGWQIGLPDDVATRMMLESQMIAALICGRTCSVVLSGYIGFLSVMNREKCTVCCKPEKVICGVNK